MTNRRREQADAFRRLADASAVGLGFPVAILLGYFFGDLLDDLFGSGPWLTWVFSVIGVAAGFLNAIRVALRVGREEDEAGSRRGGGG